MTAKCYDALVIGSGAAGRIAVKELTGLLARPLTVDDLVGDVMLTASFQ